MLVLLSPAKTLDMKAAKCAFGDSPRMLKQAAVLLSTLAKTSKASLKSMFGVSDAIAGLNHDRFQNFDSQGSKQAALAFDGPAYKGLQANAFTPDEQQFAQGHLRILCGLYGVLRPFDFIKPYRLEMSNKIPGAGGTGGGAGASLSLYDHWGATITEQLVSDLDSADPGGVSAETEKTYGKGARFVVNCASQEYSKSVLQAALPDRVTLITCDFPGASVYAKRARGLMSRFIITNQVNDPAGLKGFMGSGEDKYGYSEAQSTDTKFVFLRGAAGGASKSGSKRKSGPADVSEPPLKATPKSRRKGK